MIRLAVLSYWHVHTAGYARTAQNHPGTEVTAVWDEEPDRGRKHAAELGVPFESELADVLARPDVDGVIVGTPTNLHTEVITAAARAGKHIFTEKVLALTTREVQEILAEVERAGVTLTVSLPRLYDGYTLALRKVLAEGALGDVTLVRTRLSHGGALGDAWLPAHFFDAEQCGGGAMIDLGCHPMYLARLFLGRLPESVSASFGHVTGRTVEDNAVSVLRCEGGALGVVEAGFVNQHSPFSIEIHGTAGSALYGVPDPKLVVRSPAYDEGNSWVEVPIPPNAPGAFELFVEHVGLGTSPAENVAAAVDLTRLMEATNHSAATGSVVRL